MKVINGKVNSKQKIAVKNHGKSNPISRRDQECMREKLEEESSGNQIKTFPASSAFSSLRFL